MLQVCDRDDVSKVTLPAWPGQGYDANLVIFRTLSPICILVRTRILFRFRYDLDLCIVYICILGSFESLLYIYIRSWVPS